MRVDRTIAAKDAVTGQADGTLPRWRSAMRPQGLGRIAPFVPTGKRQPVFLLHIPRCGAGSMARFLERIYQPEGMVRAAEDRLDRIFDGQDAPIRTDCVVGQLPLVRWLHFAGAGDYARVTVLRNPWARMVSQINHLAALGPEAAGPAGSSQRALAEEVARADFTSRAGLERFCNRLRLIDVSFDNLQVRMLVTGTMSALVKQITSRDVETALRELERFAVVGFCEEQMDMQRALVRVTGISVPVGAVFEGAGRGAALSLRNTLAREALTPLYELDQELYARARQLVVARQG